MLTYPIKMMFWKIVKCMQVHARVTHGQLFPHPLRRDQEVRPCLEAPGAAMLPWGTQGRDTHSAPRAGLRHPRAGEGTARAAPHGAPTAAEDGGTAAF